MVHGTAREISWTGVRRRHRQALSADGPNGVPESPGLLVRQMQEWTGQNSAKSLIVLAAASYPDAMRSADEDAPNLDDTPFTVGKSCIIPQVTG